MNDSFPFLLPSLLESRVFNNEKISSINFALPGLDISKSGDVFKHYKNYVNPDLVILAVFPNDWPSKFWQYVNKKKMVNTYRRSMEKNVPLKSFNWIIKKMWSVYIQYDYKNDLNILREELKTDEEARIRAFRQINYIHKLAFKMNSTLVVVIIPDFIMLDETYPFFEIHNSIKLIGKEIGIQVIDTLPNFINTEPEKWHVHSVDNHPNEHAHKLIAQIIASKIHAPFLKIPENPVK